MSMQIPPKADPAISVVIPTHNRPNLLMRCLRGLAMQQLGLETFEVLVVADSCTDGTVRMVEESAPGLPYRCRVLRVDALHAATARNTGAGAASGGILLFLDDDMEPSPGFLQAHLSGHSTHDVVLGYAHPVLPPAPTRWQIGARLWWEERFWAMASPRSRLSSQDFFSGNFSVRRTLFLELGGFDDTLPRLEDYELGARLLKAGARVTFRSDARADHLETNDVRSWIRRGRGDGKAQVMIWKKHPGLPLELAALGSPLLKRWSNSSETRPFGPRKIPGSAVLVKIGASLLRPLELVKARTIWRVLSSALYEAHYWKGVSQDFASRRECLRWIEERAVEISSVALQTIYLPSVGTVQSVPTESRRLLGPGQTELLQAMLAKGISAGDFRRTVGMLPLPAGVRVIDFGWETIPITPMPGHQGLLLVLTYAGRPFTTCGLISRPEGTTVVGDDLNRLVSLQNLLRTEVDNSKSPSEDIHFTEPSDPKVTVVVCTRDRPSELSRCLQSLHSLDYPNYEVVVVDNCSRDPDSIREAIEPYTGVRLIREEAPGLDRARNRGIMESHGEIVAFMDDDAVAHSGWLRAIAMGFSDPEVSALTGLVLSAEIHTRAQWGFELYGGMGKGFRPMMVRRETLEGRDILWSHSWGVGTNMAFRRKIFAETGCFDPALDVGTPAAGGGDVEFFHRLVRLGHTLRYEPGAMVLHYHRKDAKGLRRQVFNNGRSFPAYLRSVYSQAPDLRRSVLRYGCIDWGIFYLTRNIVTSPLLIGKFRFQLALAESLGAIFWLGSQLAKHRDTSGHPSVVTNLTTTGSPSQ